jgi:hypothetical protein
MYRLKIQRSDYINRPTFEKIERYEKSNRLNFEKFLTATLDILIATIKAMDLSSKNSMLR